MPVFRNVSDKAFVDGNIEVQSGQTITVEDPARIDQLTNQYGWQFKNVEGERVQKNQAPQAPENKSGGQSVGKPLSKMNKGELINLANKKGIEVTDGMTNKELVEVFKHSS